MIIYKISDYIKFLVRYLFVFLCLTEEHRQLVLEFLEF